MRHPFDGIIDHADGAPPASAEITADRSRRSFLSAAVAVLAGAAATLKAAGAQAQRGRGEMRSQRPATPPGRNDLGGPGRSEFGRSRGGPDRVTTLALGEEGGPGRSDFRSNRPERMR